MKYSGENMEKGKVIIVAGNKRSGKTTLAMKLHKEYNYNYYNFDMLLDVIEGTFTELNDGDEKKYIKLLENMVERSLKDAENYGVNSVYDYIFEPEHLKDFKYRDKVQIIFLANLDANENNIREDFKKYSKPFDWPSYVSPSDIERNVLWILNKNKTLIQECENYNFRLINTSRGEVRDRILEEICVELNK